MTRAQRRKFHYIYKITNTLNGKFYIGMHSTDNLEDGYFGSGKLLWRSINKHGKENHEMEILEHYFSREDLAAREKELVNKELLSNFKCLNIRLGGDAGGGWDTSNIDLTARAKTLNKIRSEKIKNDPNFAEVVSQSAKNAYNSALCNVDQMLKLKEEKYGSSNCWLGKKHSEDSKLKMRKTKNVGESNSQFGTCWINKDEVAKKIKKEDLQLWIDLGWSKGRRLKQIEIH